MIIIVCFQNNTHVFLFINIYRKRRKKQQNLQNVIANRQNCAKFDEVRQKSQKNLIKIFT